MVIVSISISEKMLGEVDQLKDEMGFSGRSEVIRAGLRTLLNENREAKQAGGKIKSVLLVVHEKENEGNVTEAKHDFEDIIATHIHSGLKSKCLEIFVLEGDAQRVSKFFGINRANRNVSYAKLITP